ncbi:MAG: EAL domain-containing protein [Gammaproteobacteria bacterium]|nr:EAL domain-containing protein [Gammaproteobacteria bacterium]
MKSHLKMLNVGRLSSSIQAAAGKILERGWVTKTITLLLGLIVTVLLLLLSVNSRQNEEYREFALEVIQIKDIISRTLMRSEETINNISTLYYTSKPMDADPFHILSAKALSAFEFIDGIFYFPLVTEEERSAFSSGVRIRDWGETKKRPARSWYFPLLYAEPDEHAWMMGNDALSNPDFQETIRQSVRTSRTRAILLPKSASRAQAEYWLFRALYSGEEGLGSGKSRPPASGLLALRIKGIAILEKINPSGFTFISLYENAKEGAAVPLVKRLLAHHVYKKFEPDAFFDLLERHSVDFGALHLQAIISKQVRWEDIDAVFFLKPVAAGAMLTLLLVFMAHILALRAGELKQQNREIERQVVFQTRELTRTVERMETEISTRKRFEAWNQLAARVFENTSEAIFITDANAGIIEVNAAYLAISGYERDEVIGQKPSLFKSDRQEPGFYKGIWDTLLATGIWTGEVWNRRKNENVFPIWLTINAVKDKKGERSNYIGVFSDISDVKKTEKQLQQLAYYDSLTNLPNRGLFKNRLEHEIEIAKRLEKKLAVLFLDLDRFKNVNDAMGHAAGDKLLIEVARRLSDSLRKADTVARLGGDEFTIILTNTETEGIVSRVAIDIIEKLREQILINDTKIFIGCSIGIAMFPHDGDNYIDILKKADIALYKVKDEGGGYFKFFKDEMNARSTHSLKLENNLINALKNKEFFVVYQPQVNQDNNRVVGVEALIRWNNPELGTILPGEFISIAEEIGLILPIGRWVLQTACRQGKEWLDRGLPPITVAVNLSPKQFQQADLLDMIRQTLQETGFPPHLLDIELTESAVMKDAAKAVKVMEGIVKTGVNISIDDFGTGYSSLSYLKRFPINKLKIDRSFICELEHNQHDQVITSTIVNMAKSLGIKVVAEGVEKPDQQAFLRTLNCDFGQGYLFGKPALPDDISGFSR